MQMGGWKRHTLPSQMVNKENTDPFDRNDWQRQYEWFTTKLELFDTVFRPRIKALDASEGVEADVEPI